MSHEDIYGRVLEQAEVLATMRRASGDVALMHKAAQYVDAAIEKNADARETLRGLLDMGLEKEAIWGLLASKAPTLARFASKAKGLMGMGAKAGTKVPKGVGPKPPTPPKPKATTAPKPKQTFKQKVKALPGIGTDWFGPKGNAIGLGLTMATGGTPRQYFGLGQTRAMQSFASAPLETTEGLLQKEAELASWFGFDHIPTEKVASQEDLSGPEIWHTTYAKVASALEAEDRVELTQTELYSLCDAFSKVAGDAGYIVTASTVYNQIEEPTLDGLHAAIVKVAGFRAFLKKTFTPSGRRATRMMREGAEQARGARRARQMAEASAGARGKNWPGMSSKVRAARAEAETAGIRSKAALKGHERVFGSPTAGGSKRSTSAIERMRAEKGPEMARGAREARRGKKPTSPRPPTEVPAGGSAPKPQPSQPAGGAKKQPQQAAAAATEGPQAGVVEGFSAGSANPPTRPSAPAQSAPRPRAKGRKKDKGSLLPVGLAVGGGFMLGQNN